MKPIEDVDWMQGLSSTVLLIGRYGAARTGEVLFDRPLARG